MSTKPIFHRSYYLTLLFFAAFIEKNAWAGMEDWNVNITRALLEECEAGLSPSANGMSAKKAKKKARSAGAGTHQQGQVISFQFSSGYR